MGRHGNFCTNCTIASVISDEYKSVCSMSMKNKVDYEAVVQVAQDREQWKGIVQSIAQKYCDSRKEKVIKQRKVRKEKTDAKTGENKSPVKHLRFTLMRRVIRFDKETFALLLLF